MTHRGNADKIEKDIVYPLSVNFARSTKKTRNIKVKNAQEFLQSKNIPICSEENNFYRLK